MEDFYPVLCGGTFLTQLLLFPKPGAKKSSQNHIKGIRNTFSEIDVLRALEILVIPDLQKGDFDPRCSEFKSCKKSFFSSAKIAPDSKYISSFDQRVKTQYKSVFTSMEEISDKYIASDTVSQTEFVKRILDLICQDKSISDDDIFYVSEHGLALKKAALDKKDLELCFPAFLLGVWHFVIVHRADNTMGAATFLNWHKRKPSGDDKHGRWKYTGNLGVSYEQEIHLLSEPPISFDAVAFSAPDVVASPNDGVSSSIAIPEDTVKEETSASSRVVNADAALSVPQECKICLCCRDWQGNVFRAFRDQDGIYGDCDAQGKRVLSTGTCAQFRIEYTRSLRYLEWLKLPHLTAFYQEK